MVVLARKAFCGAALLGGAAILGNLLLGGGHWGGALPQLAGSGLWDSGFWAGSLWLIAGVAGIAVWAVLCRPVQAVTRHRDIPLSAPAQDVSSPSAAGTEPDPEIPPEGAAATGARPVDTAPAAEDTRTETGPQQGLRDLMRGADAFRSGVQRPAEAPAPARTAEQEADDWFAAFAARRAELRRALDGGGVPVRNRFQVRFPQRATTSWLGGVPVLPEECTWPEIAGAPAEFVAQIDLSSLEDETWSGLGPREGWLVVFRGVDDTAFAMHTLETGCSVAPPPGVPVSPRWYLAASRDLAGAAPSVSADLDQLFDRARLNEVGFHPFDWTTALDLLQAAVAGLTAALRRWEATPTPSLDPSERAALIEARRLTLARLRLALRRTEERAAQRPFDKTQRDWVIGAIAGLTDAGWQPHPGPTRPSARTMLQYPFYGAYKARFEAQAREAYAAAPEALPPAARDLFVPHWVAEAEAEALFVGNPPEPGQDAAWPVLLDLPLGRFAQAGGAAQARWVVSIAHEDLETGSFARCEAEWLPFEAPEVVQFTPGNLRRMRAGAG